jgi:type II secretory ATPase GspE/PulE/Tfp pilus assembly ATPase PilB-like protein
MAVAMPAVLRSQPRYAEAPEALLPTLGAQPGGLRVDEQDARLETIEELVLGPRMREEAPAIALLNTIVEQAIQQSSSDIHIEPGSTGSMIRMRVDGVMYDGKPFRRDEHPSLISRLKILARMNIAERRLPQDGRFAVRSGTRRWDVRVSTVPGVSGEKAVLRLLPKDSGGMQLRELGFGPNALGQFEDMINRPYGMMLVTGPTGSGKTTTLYSALQGMDCVGKNVITIEDPVEYELPRVTQIQVHPKIGLTFASGLRSVLRQDPDILMVGEIRDSETLQMAVQSALTGHLVFSTLHCNDAAGAAARCIDMGLEPFLLTSAVTGIVAQRLVRKVCSKCGEEKRMDAEMAARFGVQQGTRYREGCGCDVCRGTGFKGRMATFEILRMTEVIKKLIHQKEPASVVRAAAVAEGMMPLNHDAITKVLAGLTTPAEILRAVYTEEAAS